MLKILLQAAQKISEARRARNRRAEAYLASTADYLELYDRIGRLLAVSWFDRFGIERVALDRGLLHETYEPEGVFVLVLEGDSI